MHRLSSAAFQFRYRQSVLTFSLKTRLQRPQAENFGLCSWVQLLQNGATFHSSSSPKIRDPRDWECFPQEVFCCWPPPGQASSAAIVRSKLSPTRGVSEGIAKLQRPRGEAKAAAGPALRESPSAQSFLLALSLGC